MNTLYQGWTPRPQTVAEIISDNIDRFIAHETILVARIDECENNGWYGEHPEDRDIHICNLAFIRKTIANLIDRYGELTTRDDPRPTQLRMERAAVLVSERVEA
jgi:hypothetical protein